MPYLFNFFSSLFNKCKCGKSKKMSGKFEIFKDVGGQYRFRLKAVNGEIILASESYKSKSGAKKGVASVKTNAPFYSSYERKFARDGKSMFNLKAANHEVIGTSEQYESEASRNKGIESVRVNAPDAVIVDLT